MLFTIKDQQKKYPTNSTPTPYTDTHTLTLSSWTLGNCLNFSHLKHQFSKMVKCMCLLESSYFPHTQEPFCHCEAQLHRHWSVPKDTERWKSFSHLLFKLLFFCGPFSLFLASLSLAAVPSRLWPLSHCEKKRFLLVLVTADIQHKICDLRSAQSQQTLLKLISGIAKLLPVHFLPVKVAPHDYRWSLRASIWRRRRARQTGGSQRTAQAIWEVCTDEGDVSPQDKLLHHLHQPPLSHSTAQANT